MTRRVTIDRLAYGAHGVARDAGKVVFVRNAAPGDVVDIDIHEDHGSYAYASVAGIVEASQVRREAPCAYLPLCGGCPWQHVTYEAQLRAKEENVRDHLRRIAGIDNPPLLPILPSPLEYGYRSRLTLRTDQGRSGFYAAGTHDLIEVQRCLLGSDIVNRAWPEVTALVASLHSAVRRFEITQRTVPDSDAVCALGEVEGQLARVDDATIGRFLARSKHVRGVVLHGKGWHRSWGDDEISISPREDLQLTAGSGAFTQVNPLGNRLLVEHVQQLSALTSRDRVLDVYAGIGNLTFALAPHAAHVTAIEQDRIAAQAAAKNAQHLGFANVEVIQSSARRALQQHQRLRGADVVVVDPPRSGIADLTDLLLDLAPPRLIYVSCNPSTLARDLKRLATRYRVEVVQPIDLFPHTYHVEVLVRAVLL